MVQERDGLGNDTPFEYVTAVQEGAFYGWPWFYIGEHEDPNHEGARPDLRGKITVGDVDDLRVWGRPVGVTVAQDGSLYVTEDGNGTIWRVSHSRPPGA